MDKVYYRKIRHFKIHFNMYKMFDIILFCILIFIVLSMIYSFYEPKLVLMNKSHGIVSDVKTIESLKECADKYYNALIYEKKYVVNEMETTFNQKNSDDIKKIKEKYGDSLTYDLIVKQAEKLGNDVYLCNIEITPQLDKDTYDWNNVKTAKMIIKLNKNNYTFKIYYDEFSLT